MRKLLRWLGKLLNWLRKPGNYLLPSGIAWLAMLLIAFVGTGPVKTTLFGLLASWLSTKALRRWGPKEEERARPGPKLLVASGIVLVVLTALGLIFRAWLQVGNGQLSPGIALLQTLLFLLLMSTSSLQARSLVTIPTRQAPPRKREKTASAGRDVQGRILRMMRQAGRPLTAAEVARAARLSRAEVDAVLDKLYLNDKVTMEVTEDGDLVYAVPQTALRLSAPPEEELDELLRRP